MTDTRGHRDESDVLKRLTYLLSILICFASTQGCGFLPVVDDADSADFEIFVCGLTTCPVEMTLCILDPVCRDTLACNAECGSSGVNSQQQACHLVCQLEQGAKSELYGVLVQCFAENGCLPSLPDGTDGQCLVTSENIQDVYVPGSLEELEGTWLEVRGLNCGVPGSNWEGGYDALPCRSSSWIFNANQWWYHTSFCAPAENSACSDNLAVHLIAAPTLSESEPGLLEVAYANPPLQPQDERWYILARPHPDWMMYTYCGSTPIGEYAGVNIITRVSDPPNTSLPPEVDAAFRDVAGAFHFRYEDMCVTDQTQCPQVMAEADVQAWVDGL